MIDKATPNVLASGVKAKMTGLPKKGPAYSIKGYSANRW